MRKYGLLIAIALLVLVNIMVFAGVVRNRTGEPEAVVELTERELSLYAFRPWSTKENTGISLRLRWNQYPYYGKYSMGKSAGSQYGWFDKAKLEDIGFDCTVPLTDEKAEIHYEKMLPRKAYVVFEYEGKTWDALIDRARISLSDMAERVQKGAAADKDLKDANDEYERVLKTWSRLFAVDAGKDPVKLRQQYPDSKHYIVMAAKVRLQHKKPYGNETGNKELPKLEGYVEEILIDAIHVPMPMSTVLEELVSKSGRQANSVYPYVDMHKQDPLYKVTLHYGNRFEPWVADIQQITP